MSESAALVCVPTYNEAENVAAIVGRVRSRVPDAHVLVIDDASPDGTGEIADRLAAEDPAVHVLHRTAKNGLGAAYLAGFDWGLRNGFGVLVEMDADGSHRPEDLPKLLTAIDRGADVVLGSRYVPGGRVEDWPASRQALSRGGNVYARLMLGGPLHDMTGGFRAYRSTALERMDLASVASHGYCFQVDLARRALQARLRVAEVPIVFRDRELGTSKMGSGVVLEALLRVTVWGVGQRLRALLRPVRQRVTQPR